MRIKNLPKDACREGVEFYKSCKTEQEAWETCERPDWMLWAHARSICPVPSAYAALALMWAQETDHSHARYNADVAVVTSAIADDPTQLPAIRRYAVSDAACAADSVRFYADGCTEPDPKRCVEIRAALPWFPGFK